jgi:phospholipase D1/2
LIAAIEALHHSGRTLQPFEIPHINDAEAALADSQLLDPEQPKTLWNLVRRASRPL